MKSILKFTSLFMLLGAVVLVSCKEEEPTPAGDPVASFQYSINETNYLEVSFANFSENAASYAWDFGDQTASVEENPTVTYNAEGDYNVTLTVTNADGKTNSKSETITITDPDKALKLLTGDVSKTWVLVRDGSTAMSLGPDASNPAGWWEGSSNDGKRPCLYYQESTFAFDGTYSFDDKGSFWAEFGVFNGVEGCDSNTIPESCFAISGPILNECGDDVSTWGSGTHAFTYDTSTGKVVLSGDGAWFGIPKLDEVAGVTITPRQTTTFTIQSITQEDGYDLMHATMFINNNDLWTFYYASYTGTAPTVVDEFVPPSCEPEVAISPALISHTFASNDEAEWDLMQFVAESGSGLELGVANPDPTDAATTPLVGKYVRKADVPYQEQQFKLSPVNAINFENLTTITMDVYLPSTNDYANGLTDNVFVGFGATKCTDVYQWYENQIEYQQLTVAKDQWVTVTLALNAPGFVNDNNPDGVVDVYGRNDFDMIYINFGGGNHNTGAEFFMKNFKIQ